MNAVLEPSSCHHCFRLFFSCFSGVTTCNWSITAEKSNGKIPTFAFHHPRRCSPIPLLSPVLCANKHTHTQSSTLSETNQWWLIPCKVLHNHRSETWLWSATWWQCSTQSLRPKIEELEVMESCSWFCNLIVQWTRFFTSFLWTDWLHVPGLDCTTVNGISYKHIVGHTHTYTPENLI